MDRPKGTLEIKDVENRLVEERSMDEGSTLSSKSVLNLEQLNFEVKNVKVLDPNWSGNLKELVTVNDGGSVIERVKKSVEFPLITSILYKPGFARTLGVKTIRHFKLPAHDSCEPH